MACSEDRIEMTSNNENNVHFSPQTDHDPLDHNHNHNNNHDHDHSLDIDISNVESGQGTASPAQQSPRPLFCRVILYLWAFILDQWFLVAMGILITISSQVQVPHSQQATKKTVVNYFAVAVIFLMNGLTIPTDVLLQNLGRWKMHIYINVLCYLLPSSLALALTALLGVRSHFMNADLLDGFVILGCLPTAISFNAIMTTKANGNTALTITQSTLGNLLGPFLSPVLIKLFLSTHTWFIDVLPPTSNEYSELYRRVFKQLGLSIFLPLAVGQATSIVFPTLKPKVIDKFRVSKLSSFALLILIWSTYDSAFESRAFDGVPSTNLAFIVLLSVILFLVCFILSWLASALFLSGKDAIAVAYLVPTKTPAMGVPLVAVLFVGLQSPIQSRLQIPMVIYQAIQISLGSISTILLREWEGKKKYHEES